MELKQEDNKPIELIEPKDIGSTKRNHGTFMAMVICALLLLPLCNYGQEGNKDSSDDQTTTKTVKPDAGPLPIKLENYEVEEEKKLLDKILQFFKFSENSDNKEKERVNQFLKQQIEEGNLSIAPDSIRIIQSQLDSILLKMIIIERIIKAGEDGMEIDIDEELSASKESESKPAETDSIVEPPNPVPLKLTDFELEEKEKLVDKIVQFFKFGENKKNREKKRINEFLQQQIEEGNLKVGPEAVIEIQEQLNDILQTITNIEEILKASKKTEDTEGEDVKEEEMTTKAMIDYLIQQYDSITQRTEEKNALEDLELKSESDIIYDSLQRVKYAVGSIGFKNLPWQTRKEGDTIIHFKEGLKTKKQIIGWHNAWLEDESDSYNFNFLSGINYFGYRLKSDGTTIKPADLSSDLAPRVLKNANSANLDIYLTIYAKGSNAISGFLNSMAAQDTLIKTINKVFSKNFVNGINIYFKNTSPRDAYLFRQFVENLSQNLESLYDPDTFRSPPKIIITVPGIVDQSSLKAIMAYDFPNLNKLVDFYMVETDRLINTNSSIPQSLSPLTKSIDLESGTIESTINTYIGNEVPKEKLIMTVSYSGVEWEVNESGDLKQGVHGIEIEYKNILMRIDSLRKRKINIVDSYDPLQAASSIYYQDLDKNNQVRHREIWFDGARGLNEKYKYAASDTIGIAGVAIRELNSYAGYNSFGYRHQRLWKVLGAALVEITTVYGDTVIYRKKEDVDRRRVFIEDFRWAVAVKLAYWEVQNNKKVKRHCTYNAEKAGAIDSDSLWQVYQPYRDKQDFGNLHNSPSRTKDGLVYLEDLSKEQYLNKMDRNVLLSELQCTCLNARWKYYSKNLVYIALVCLLLFFVVSRILREMERMNYKNKLIRDVFVVLWFLFLMLIVLSLLLAFYLAPYIKWIGAGSEGSNIWIIIAPTILGIVIGVGSFLWHRNRKQRNRLVPEEANYKEFKTAEDEMKDYFEDI